ncbi:MAG: FHA domain-containing protein [Candidatus Cloacimonetes bacterium]|nr:FHA domain-containing protein [Candidatus Cloacimonadota bacterium]
MRYIYINQENVFKAKSDDLDTITWEIDNDNDLDIRSEKNELIITPDKNAIKKAFRRVKYTVEDTGYSDIIDFEIVESEDSQKTESVKPVVIQEEIKITKAEVPLTQEKILINKPSVSIDFCEEDSCDITAVATIQDCSFVESQYNSCLSVNQNKITIKNLPAGFYTLIYTTQNEKHTVYVHSTEKKKTQMISSQPVQQPVSNQQSPQSKQAETEQDERKNWPITKEKCAIEIYFQGQKKDKYPIIKHHPVLVGRKSLSMKVVDIDLSRYSDKLDRISRNHLKIWQNEEFLFMKNTGSHRCTYNNQEVFPEDKAVLKMDGEIVLGEFSLKIVKD